MSDGRQIRLPDPLGEPRAARPSAEQPLQLVGHPDELADPVALGQGGEDRLIPAAADDLDLAAPDEPPEALDELGPFGGDPVEEGTGVVESELNAGMPFEGLEHRQVGLFVGLGNDPAEVADGLVVVDRQRYRNASGHVLGIFLTRRGGWIGCDSTVLTLRPRLWYGA